MTDSIKSVSEYIDIGKIKIVQKGSEFPWEMFIGGELNYAFAFDSKDGLMNDLRLWINENITETVYLSYSNWSPTPCKIAFAKPDDAAKFVLKFSEILKRIKI